MVNIIRVWWRNSKSLNKIEYKLICSEVNVVKKLGLNMLHSRL